LKKNQECEYIEKKLRMIEKELIIIADTNNYFRTNLYKEQNNTLFTLLLNTKYTVIREYTQTEEDPIPDIFLFIIDAERISSEYNGLPRVPTALVPSIKRKATMEKPSAGKKKVGSIEKERKKERIEEEMKVLRMVNK
jgi:hypothetical protein